MLNVDAAPTIAQLPLTVPQAASIANAVMNWTLKGSLDVTGPDGPESLTLAGGEIVTTLNLSGGTPATINEFQINCGYTQYAQQSSLGDGSWTAEISFATGLSRTNAGPNYPGIVEQGGQLFLAFNGASDPVGSPFLNTTPFQSTPYIRIAVGFGGLVNGPYPQTGWSASAVAFDILGVSQTLWQPPGYTFTGTLSATGDASAGWFGWNGTFDVNTGNRL